MGNGDWGIEIPGGYFDEKRHLYRNSRGTIIPSTTQVFSLLGLVDLDGIPQDMLAWKRDYGLAVHAAIEYLVQNDLNWDSLDEMIIPAVAGIEQFLKKIEYQSETAEQRMVHSLFGMEFGLTTDGTGTMMYHGERRHVVLDLKTAVKEHASWRWQLGAYGTAQAKVDKGWLGMVIQVNKDGEVKPFYYDLFPAGREFQTLLASCILGINAGIYKPGK